MVNGSSNVSDVFAKQIAIAHEGITSRKKCYDCISICNNVHHYNATELPIIIDFHIAVVKSFLWLYGKKDKVLLCPIKTYTAKMLYRTTYQKSQNK